MADANELVETLKRAAVEAMQATKPVNVYFGEVVSAAPLKINVEQKMMLGEKQVLWERTGFPLTVTGLGNKLIYLYKWVVVGDEVILIRQQEGQKFIVLDRIGT